MKVDKFQNYSVGVKASEIPIRKQNMSNVGAVPSSPSFTGAEKVTAEMINKIKGDFMNLFPKRERWWIDFINKFKNLQGEKGGIVITAVGTGAVAPIFIAFNPFVKAKPDATPEEKDEVRKTKEYTAMRQPISAALAIGLQTPILKYIDKVLDNWTNNPEYAKNMWITLDRSALNNNSYIENTIKKELKTKKLEDLMAEAGMKRIKTPEGKLETDAEVIQRLVKYRAGKQVDAVADGLKATNKIKIGSRFVENGTLAEVLNDQIDDYVKQISELRIDDKGIQFYLKRAKDLVDNEATLREILDPKKIAALPRDAKKATKADPQALKGYLEELLKGDYNKDVKVLLQEIIDKAPGVRESRCSRTLDRIDTVKSACGGEFSLDKYCDLMKNKNKKLDEIIKSMTDLKIPQADIAGKKVTEDTIKNTISELEKKCIIDSKDPKFAKILGEIDVFAENMESLGKKVYKDVVKTYKKFVDSHYKGFNQITKIMIGVCITLPITCTALNWVYPRFMDLFFPGLAGTKKDKEPQVKEGGNK